MGRKDKVFIVLPFVLLNLMSGGAIKDVCISLDSSTLETLENCIDKVKLGGLNTHKNKEKQ